MTYIKRRVVVVFYIDTCFIFIFCCFFSVGKGFVKKESLHKPIRQVIFYMSCSLISNFTLSKKKKKL